jgi:hypothetical protein
VLTMKKSATATEVTARERERGAPGEGGRKIQIARIQTGLHLACDRTGNRPPQFTRSCEGITTRSVCLTDNYSLSREKKQ